MPLKLLKDHLWLRILLGMVLGIIAAIYVPIPDVVKEWVILPGDIFMALLKMIIVPLVLASVILGIAGAGSVEAFERLGIRIVPYFILTTAVAIAIGMGITSIVQPGLLIDQQAVPQASDLNIQVDAFKDLSVPQRIMNVIPVNPLEAQLEKNMRRAGGPGWR